MPFTITFQPLNKIAGVKPKTVTTKTAGEAWKLVDSLHRSDEKTDILDEYGSEISWVELKALAEEEAR